MLYEVGKRIMDIFGAILGIILFSPLMVLGAILVKVFSFEGPVFADIPLRSGKNGEPFEMYKFRSMHHGAHEKMLADPHLSKIYRENNYKLDNDPRWHRAGMFLRKSSIDEMPQFFNVLKGEMSIVGPRAYFPFELKERSEEFPETKPYIEKLLTIKPGLTGPWQVSGRSKIGFVERTRMDAAYASKRSLLYDLMIILRTPFALLSGKGAY